MPMIAVQVNQTQNQKHKAAAFKKAVLNFNSTCLLPSPPLSPFTRRPQLSSTMADIISHSFGGIQLPPVEDYRKRKVALISGATPHWA